MLSACLPPIGSCKISAASKHPLHHSFHTRLISRKQRRTTRTEKCLINIRKYKYIRTYAFPTTMHERCTACSTTTKVLIKGVPWVRSILQQEAYHIYVTLPTSHMKRGFVAPVPLIHVCFIAEQHPCDIFTPCVRGHLCRCIVGFHGRRR